MPVAGQKRDPRYPRASWGQGTREQRLALIRANIDSYVSVEPNSGCWIWMSVLDGDGYGRVDVLSKKPRAHRVLYEIFRGPIPLGLVLDHLCRSPWCVNPAHLEAVTGHENNRRSRSITALNAVKTHCKRGHEFTAENTIRIKSGRSCRACKAVYKQRQYA